MFPSLKRVDREPLAATPSISLISFSRTFWGSTKHYEMHAVKQVQLNRCGQKTDDFCEPAESLEKKCQPR